MATVVVIATAFMASPQSDAKRVLDARSGCFVFHPVENVASVFQLRKYHAFECPAIVRGRVPHPGHRMWCDDMRSRKLRNSENLTKATKKYGGRDPGCGNHPALCTHEHRRAFDRNDAGVFERQCEACGIDGGNMIDAHVSERAEVRHAVALDTDEPSFSIRIDSDNRSAIRRTHAENSIRSLAHG